jgi:hypothetical protein
MVARQCRRGRRSASGADICVCRIVVLLSRPSPALVEPARSGVTGFEQAQPTDRCRGHIEALGTPRMSASSIPTAEGCSTAVTAGGAL